jgi:hypothetical protein
MKAAMDAFSGPPPSCCKPAGSWSCAFVVVVADVMDMGIEALSPERLDESDVVWSGAEDDEDDGGCCCCLPGAVELDRIPSMSDERMSRLLSFSCNCCCC